MQKKYTRKYANINIQESMQCKIYWLPKTLETEYITGGGRSRCRNKYAIQNMNIPENKYKYKYKQI